MEPLVDALSHLEDRRIDDPRALLERAAAAGVSDVISAGTDPLVDELELVGARHPEVRVWRAFGVHPRAAREGVLDAQLEALDHKLSLPGVVALGECGLDGRDGMPPLELQERALRAQLEVARRRQLPVILHHVQATERFLRVLEEQGPLPAGGMLHGYTAAPELLPRYLALGLHVSFGGMVTRPSARRCRASAREVTIDRLLVESDAPDHPPVGARSALSEPAAIPLVLEALAELRGEPVEAVAAATAENARRLFFLPRPGARLA